jgi:hypothetical protein
MTRVFAQSHPWWVRAAGVPAKSMEVASGKDEEVAMIWALLAFLGVPLWLCAVGIFALVYRNRALRRRHGDIPVRVLQPGKTRWVRGHAVWVAEVFAWRGSPAAWNETLELIVGVSVQDPSPEELKRLHHLGDAVVVASLTTDDDTVLRVATTADHRAALLGPYARASGLA